MKNAKKSEKFIKNDILLNQLIYTQYTHNIHTAYTPQK